MTKDISNPNASSAPSVPYMLGYTVRPGAHGGKSYWSKVAIAWAHKDGLGFNVQMDAIPVDGKLVLRAVTDEDQPQSEVIEREPR